MSQLKRSLQCTALTAMTIYITTALYFGNTHLYFVIKTAVQHNTGSNNTIKQKKR